MFILQYIAVAIYIVVMFLANKHYKKTVIVWTPLSLLFNSQVCPIYSPAIALTVVINLSLIILYLFKRGSYFRKQYNLERFKLKSFMAFSLFSVLLSMLFSNIPFASSINQLVKTTIIDFGMVYIFFRCIHNREDIYLFVKACICVALVITLDALVENFTHRNPIGDFIYYTSPHTDAMRGRSFFIPFGINGQFKQRFGLTRCYSVFGLHIRFGVACVYLFFLLLIFIKNKWPIFKGETKIKKLIARVTLLLLGIGIVLSNSKTPMLGFCIILLTIYKIRSFADIKLMLPLFVGFVAILYYVPDYLNNFLSLTDESLAEEGGGSTIALREIQMQYVMKLFSQSPLLGNGINAAAYYSKNVSGYEMILGAESVWLKLACDQGVLGFFAYLYRYLNLWNFTKGIVPTKVVKFFLLSLFVMETTTGFLNMQLWLSILIVVRRAYIVNKGIVL